MNRWMVGVALVAASLVVGCNNSSTKGAQPLAIAATTTQGALEPDTSEKLAEIPRDNINLPPDVVPAVGTRLELTEDEWRERLTREQFRVLRMEGTEFPGSGVYNKFDEDGTYHCSACNNPLFSSKTKFDSKTGWPSYWAPIEEGRVTEVPDSAHGMTRTEVECAVCGGHQGHVFNDGPEPTGLRYCINSVALYFRPDGAGGAE